MIILGIDPGYERLGVAILEKKQGKESLLFSGCVKTSSKLEFSDRLVILGKEIEKIIKKYKPKVAAIEKVFFTTNQKTAMRVAEVRGMLIYLAIANKLKVEEPTPLQIKMALTGYGKADKNQIKEMVKNILNLDLEEKKYGDDEIDAIAAAVSVFAYY